MNEKVKSLIHSKNIRYVKIGIIWAVIGGLDYGVSPSFQTLALGTDSFLAIGGVSLLLIPLIMACLQDLFAAIMVFTKNLQAGKQREYFRVLSTKPGRFVVLAAFFGGPMALGSYMAAVVFAGPVYALIITAMFPAIGAILSRIILKEKISPRGYLGIVLAILGSIIISYIPPSGDAYPQFYLGIIFATITAFGWALEAVTSVSGMDFIDPEIALGLRFLVSSVLSFLILPIASGLGFASWGILFGTVFKMSSVWLIFGAFFAGSGYFLYYKSANAAGAARAMAINILYTITATFLGLIFWGATLGINFFIGLIVLLIGVTLVVGKPSELLSLRIVK